MKNFNKNDIINIFTGGKDTAINDNTNWVCRIICLIEFYERDYIAAYLDKNDYKSLCICYLDENNSIHISTIATKCNIAIPEKDYIEAYNDSSRSNGYKIRAVYFKDHIDKYTARNSRFNIIRKFKHGNGCIGLDDISGRMINIIGLVELNNKESDLLAITQDQLLCTCYIDSNGRIHRSNHIYKIFEGFGKMNRDSALKYNMFALNQYKIKSLYFKKYTDNIL